MTQCLEGSRFGAHPVDQATFALCLVLIERGHEWAAPGNDPAFGCSIRSSNRDTVSKHGAG